MPEAGLWSTQRRGLTLGLVLTITLVAAEALAVPTAMPIVARDLGGLELFGLVFSAFAVGSLLGIVVVGALIDREGVVKPFVAGLVLFGVGLTIGGLTPSMPVLIVARFIQGIGGGAVPPVAYVAIGRALPPSLRPQMFAMLSTAWVLPGVFGPAIAGFVAQELHWRLVFLGLLPLIALPGAMATRALMALHAVNPGTTTASASVRRRALDGLAVAGGVALLTAGLTSAEPRLAVGLAVTGAAVTLAMLARLTPAGTLRLARGYPSAVLLRGLTTLAFFSIDAYVALLLQDVRGWSATAAGVALTGATVSWTVGSWVQARYSRRHSPEAFVRAGFPVIALGIAGLALGLSPSLPAEVIVPSFALAGFGMGLTYSQFALIVLRDVSAADQGRATAGLTLSDAIGTAVGNGLTAAMVAAAIRAGAGPAPGIAGGIAVGTTLALVGFLAAGRLRMPSPAAGAAPARPGLADRLG